MKFKKSAIILASLLAATTSFAQAPVVDLTQDQDQNTAPVVADSSDSQPAAPDYSRMSTGERLARLEQQSTNMSQMNFPARIDQLQQQVQQLQGQLDLQTHQLQTLQDQQKNFYQDLNQQIAQLKTPGAATTTATANTKLATPAIAAAANNISEQTAYQNAFTALQAKKYDVAISGFNNYLQKFPKGQFAVNAHYWLGEIYSLQNKSDQAAQQFQTILTQYPKDQKVPDAMFKLAVINDQQGKKAEAKKALQQIVQKYPGTPAAQLATLRLKSGA